MTSETSRRLRNFCLHKQTNLASLATLVSVCVTYFAHFFGFSSPCSFSPFPRTAEKSGPSMATVVQEGPSFLDRFYDPVVTPRSKPRTLDVFSLTVKSVPSSNFI